MHYPGSLSKDTLTFEQWIQNENKGMAGGRTKQCHPSVIGQIFMPIITRKLDFVLVYSRLVQHDLTGILKKYSILYQN